MMQRLSQLVRNKGANGTCSVEQILGMKFAVKTETTKTGCSDEEIYDMRVHLLMSTYEFQFRLEGCGLVSVDIKNQDVDHISWFTPATDDRGEEETSSAETDIGTIHHRHDVTMSRSHDITRHTSHPPANTRVKTKQG